MVGNAHSPESESGEFYQGILARGDSSAIPPRVAFQPPNARKATIEEIDDFAKDHAAVPPATLQAPLTDQRYLHVPKAFATLDVKRKTIDLHKARLRTSGDIAPLTDVACVSSPASHRTCVRIVTALPTLFRRNVKALDIGHAFLQSPNLNEEGRLIIIPPPMITLQRRSTLPDPATDLRTAPRSRLVSPHALPLYGGRDAPTRRFVVFSSRLRNDGYRKLKNRFVRVRETCSRWLDRWYIAWPCR